MKRSRRNHAFTLLELLTVVAIIIVLAALILHGMGYAQQKAASSRAASEIAAIGLMNEAFKIDHGTYVSSAKTDELDPNATKPSDAAYGPSTGVLTAQLLGPQVLHSSADPDNAHVKLFKKNWTKSYGGVWKPDGLGTTATTISLPNIYKSTDDEPDLLIIPVRCMVDPFGYAYGYSTKGVFNPTFDLWSAAGTTDKTAAMQLKWVKNW